MKKILFVDEHKVVNYAGGVEKVICSFANVFMQKGYELAIACMDKEKGRPFYALDERVPLVNLWYSYGNGDFGGLRWFGKKIQKELLRSFAGSQMKINGKKIPDPKQQYFFAEFVARLGNFITEWQPDLLICISADGAVICQQVLAASQREIPVIAMCHTDPGHFYADFTEKQIEAWKKCFCVQVLMNSFRKGIEDLGVKKVVRIANAVAQIPDSEVKDMDTCQHRIITVGRIDGAAKRQHLLIEGFALIAKKYPEWSVHIYGNVANKRYKKKLDQLIQDHDLTGQVFFAGVTDHITDVYRASDIFVFPSEYEGFGLALAEAMSMGLAIVGCKDCMAVSELLREDCGELVTPDGQSMAQGLVKLIDSPAKRVYYGARAHERAKEFSPERIWSEWESLIAQVI